MFGIKTKILKLYHKKVFKISQGRLYSKHNAQSLMNFFQADTRGHRSNKKRADLGYGWIHYGLIRLIKPKRILCIGSRYGFIPAIMAQACKDNNFGHVDFVDAGYGEGHKNSWTGVGFWKTQKGRNIFATYGLKEWIKTFIMTTKAYEKTHKLQRYQYIYVDGDHSYNGVKTDYNLFWPKLDKGGFIAFHDISITEPQPEGIYGVRKLWEQLKKAHSSIAFEYKISGLGIVQKTKD